LLVEVEMPFKSKGEGLQILRWQLRNTLPVEPAELCLDYQILERKEDGGLRLAVAVMTRAVLEQYEGVLEEAGYHGVVVDFHSLQLYNYYRPRLELGNDTVFVSVEDGALAMQCFEDHRLMFHRSREIGHDLDMVFRELTRSLVAAREACPGLRRSQLFVHTDWLEQEPLREALRLLFEREPTLLDPHLQRLTEGNIDLPDWRARGLVAAVGAAERLI
jgi:type IV pilus assembly protein PilM